MIRLPLNSSPTRLLIRLREACTGTRGIRMNRPYFLFRCCIFLVNLLFHMGNYMYLNNIFTYLFYLTLLIYFEDFFFI